MRRSWAESIEKNARVKSGRSYFLENLIDSERGRGK